MGPLQIEKAADEQGNPGAWVALDPGAEKHGLGRLEVTNQKDYDLIRYYDDRAIQVVPNQGKSVGCLANGRRG